MESFSSTIKKRKTSNMFEKLFYIIRVVILSKQKKQKTPLSHLYHILDTEFL